MCYSSLNMIDTARYTEDDLDAFAGYVAAVLQAMADNRDVMADAYGMPVFAVRGERLTGTRMQIDLVVDMSAIGMPTNTPISAIKSRELPDQVIWNLDDRVLIRATPEDWTPKEVADAALEMNTLLAAHQRWVGRSFDRGRDR
jgi:hypothetical protein